ncbi:MAG: sensor histidine kinase [Ignavibacteria bacterium]
MRFDNKMKIDDAAILAAFKNNTGNGSNSKGRISKAANHDLTIDNLRSMLEYSNDIITILDEKGFILYDSPSVEKILGYAQHELVGRNAFEFIHKDDIKDVYAFYNERLKIPERSTSIEYRFLKKDGNYIFLESSGINVEDNRYLNGIVVNSRDVTEKRKNEIIIKKLTAAIEQSSNTIVITDVEGNIEYVNKKFEDLTGYSKDEIKGVNPRILQSGETSDLEYRKMWTAILTGNVWQGEFLNRKKDGTHYWEKIKITPVVDHNDIITNFIAIKDDITENKMHDEQLKKALKEKEIMLKEIHHRVKNNLQIVISLLNLQASSVEDPKLKSQLIISQNRVRSMALIHQLLYRSHDLSSIGIEDYLYSISGQLLSAYGDLKDRIEIKINAAGIFFNIENAVPFGLLVNELITNSLKHGFPSSKKGFINIDLSKEDESNYTLKYSDNGIGLPLTIVNGHVTGFGMYLIETLVNQLEGTIEHLHTKGTSYKVNFRGSNYQSKFQF